MDTPTRKVSFRFSFVPTFLLLTISLTLLMGLSSRTARAQTCGEDYIVVSGDSLSKIARTVYGDLQKWSLIYNINIDTIGDNPNRILIGQKLRIICLVENDEPEVIKPVEETSTEETPTEETPVEESPTEVTPTEETPAEIASTNDTQSQDSITETDPDATSEETGNATSDSNSVQSNSAQSTSSDVATNTNVDTANTEVDNVEAIKFLTADDYAPFTDRGLINGGLVTDMLTSALENNPDKPAFEISWINDWSQHLDPLLTNFEYDLGFPWLQPDCATTPDDYRCQNFEFSHAIIQMLVLLFTDKERPITFNEDSDIEGSVLCRPNGYYTHDLEKDGRLWLTNNKIKLEQPSSIKDCFDMLIAGQVDAVALNEYTGRSAVAKHSLKDRVEVLENRPLSVEGLHVVVHKQHPRAEELIDMVNDSMTEFQLSAEYNPLVDMHFRQFWSTID